MNLFLSQPREIKVRWQWKRSWKPKLTVNQGDSLKDLGREWRFSHRVFWDIPRQCVTADCLLRSFQNFSFFWSSSMAIFNRIISSLLLLIYFSSSAYGFIEGLYCGTENCYDGNVVHLSFLFFRNKKLCHRFPYQLYYLVHADQG